MQTFNISIPEELVGPLTNILNQLKIELNGSQPKQETQKKQYDIPTLEDVTALIAEKKYHISPSRFYSYYDKRNWTVSGQGFDWKEKLKEWEANDVIDRQRRNTSNSQPHNVTPVNINDVQNIMAKIIGE